MHSTLDFHINCIHFRQCTRPLFHSLKKFPQPTHCLFSHLFFPLLLIPGSILSSNVFQSIILWNRLRFLLRHVRFWPCNSHGRLRQHFCGMKQHFGYWLHSQNYLTSALPIAALFVEHITVMHFLARLWQTLSSSGPSQCTKTSLHLPITMPFIFARKVESR